MSKAGYRWPPKETEKQPAPCFKCSTEPRLDGHTVCSSCHREVSCLKCNPGLAVAVPAHLSRGVSAADSESGWGV